MNNRTLPSRPNLDLYKKLAKSFVKAWKSGKPLAVQWEGKEAIVTRQLLAQRHPRLARLSLEELDSATILLADAQFVIALEYGFESWPKFAKRVTEIQESASPFRAFMIAASCPIAATHFDATLDEAQVLLEENPEFSSKDIYSACVVGDAKAVRGFLAKNPKLAKRKGGPLGWDALTYLCFSRFLRFDKSRSAGFVAAAKMLIDAGADVQTGWYDQTHRPTPEWEGLMYGAAALAQNAELTQLLLEHGLDPNDNETPYHSPESYDLSTVRVLASSGKMTEDSLAMMLLRKADWHDLAGIELLLEHGANPNHLLFYDSNAFQHAIKRDNDIANIRAMLDHGADPTLVNSKGISAIHLAAKRGRDDILTMFRERGYSLESDEQTSIAIACALNEMDGVRGKGIQDGGSLLSEFAGNGNSAGVLNLLSLGVPISASYWGDGYFGIPPGSSALHVASWKSQPGTVKVLIENGANVNARDGLGRTPIMLAVKACVDSYWIRRRTPDSVRMLLSAGASADGIKLPTGYDEIDTLLTASSLS